MISRTPKKAAGRPASRRSEGGKDTRYAKKASGDKPFARKPRRDDDADHKPRFRRNDDDKPRTSRPRRDGDFDSKPRFRRGDDEKPRFKRNDDEKPRRAARPRRDDERDSKPRTRRFDDEKPRFKRNDDERPRTSRPRRDGDFDSKPRFRRTDDEKPRTRRFEDDKPRFKRNDDDRPRTARPRRDGDFDRKPRARYGDDEKPRFRKDSGDRKFDKPKRTYSRRRDDDNELEGFVSTATKRTPKKESSETRLNKFIANSGICSRREADDYIAAGVVSVNGQVVTEMGYKVKPGDDVRFNGERMKGETKVYVLLNKPKDYVTTTGDPHADKTVLDLIGDKCTQRIFPVGRLDKGTTGVLLLTNDGEMTERLTHPSYNKKKIYHVFLNRKAKVADLRQLIEGIELEDGMAQADHVEFVGEDKKEVGVEIHSGRNRVVRRMFEALGYRVEKLDRVYFAGLTKKNLRRGQWRFLTEQEISALKMGAYE